MTAPELLDTALTLPVHGRRPGGDGLEQGLDSTDHPDAVVRGIACDELDWWTAAVRRVADEGALS